MLLTNIVPGTYKDLFALYLNIASPSFCRLKSPNSQPTDFVPNISQNTLEFSVHALLLLSGIPNQSRA